jgi:integrase
VSVIDSRSRREEKVPNAPGLYRTFIEGKPTTHYRFARMQNGVNAYKRFEAATLAEARATAAALWTEGPALRIDRQVTVEALAERFVAWAETEGKLAANTQAQRRHLLRAHVVPTLGPKLKAADVTAAHLRQMISKLERKGLAGASVRACVASASGMFSYAVRIDGSLAKNPVRDLERGDLPSAVRGSEPRYLSTPEVESILDHLSDEFRPLAAALYYGALRVSEALALRWQDIDTESAVIHVAGTKSKASKATIPLLPALARELNEHRKRQGALGFERIAKDALVFQTPSGASPGRRNAYRAISHAARRAGLQPEGAEPVSPHDLRHSMASAAFGLGLSPVEVSHLLRHASPAVTMSVYSALTNDQVQALGGKLAGISS